ncbi:MAG: PIG-L deacetylase family protein [Syntrophobacteraceae bacterium]
MHIRRGFILIPAALLGLALLSAQIVCMNRCPYDPGQSYVYGFTDSKCSVSQAEIVNGRLNGLAEWKAFDTAFIALDIRASYGGGFLQPKIELQSGNKKVVEEFEHNASGIRYVNISSFLTDNSGEIRIIRHSVDVQDQTVRVFLFRNVDIRFSKILVISPHPDDAEIAAFSTYCKGGVTRIVTVTAGESGADHYGDYYPSSFESYIKKGKLRVWNSITVPLMCGNIEPGFAVNLGYFDGTLATMHSEPWVSVRSVTTNLTDIGTFRKLNPPSSKLRPNAVPTWESLVSDLRSILDKFRPDIIITPYPALDTHYDHKLSTVALIEAIKDLGIRDGMLYLYVVHTNMLSYPNGDMGSTLSLPPQFDDGLFFRSVVSPELTESEQTDKLFALEAMNDLRVTTEGRTTYEALRVFFHSMIRVLLHPHFDWFRRAVRSNELFFVVPVTDIYDDHAHARILGRLEKEPMLPQTRPTN